MPKRKTQIERRDYALLERLAPTMTRKALAKQLRMSLKDFQKALRENDTARMTVEGGEADREQFLVTNLMRLVKEAKGSTPAIAAMFLLKTHFGYDDRPKGDPADSGTQVNLFLPTALSEEKALKLIRQNPPKGLPPTAPEDSEDA